MPIYENVWKNFLGLSIFPENAKNFPVLLESSNGHKIANKGRIDLFLGLKSAQFDSKINWPLTFYWALFYYLKKNNTWKFITINNYNLQRQAARSSGECGRECACAEIIGLKFKFEFSYFHYFILNENICSLFWLLCVFEFRLSFLFTIPENISHY